MSPFVLFVTVLILAGVISTETHTYGEIQMLYWRQQAHLHPWLIHRIISSRC